MRILAAVSLAVASLALSGAGGARAQVSEPFVAAGVWYPHGMSNSGRGGAWTTGGPGQDRDQWQRDLTAIKAAGFNSVRTVVDWASAEPAHGQYQFDRFGALLTAADAAGLRVIVQVDARAAPAWFWRRYQDASVQPEPGGRVPSPSNGYCMDHPGVRADLGAFIGATAAFAAGHRAFYAIDVWRNPGASSNNTAPFCYCPYTQARFRDALQRKYRGVEALNAAWGQSFNAWSLVAAPGVSVRTTPAVLDWTQFLAVKLQEDLKFRADASAPRGARLVVSHADGISGAGVDDWLMTAVVDHYGSSIPWTGLGGFSDPARHMASLDAMRSSSRDKPWWLGALQVGDANAQAASEADLRLWGWAAVSRGAGTIAFDDWPALNDGGVSADALVPARVRAAGGVAGVVGRNGSLFGPLRPHVSRVAILHHAGLRSGPVSATTSGTSERDVYKAFFDLNIQVDFIHPDEVVAGLSSRDDILYAGDVASSSTAVAEALKAFVRGGGTLIAESSAASVPQGRGAAQSLAEIFVTGARPLGGASPGAPETTASALPVGRRADPVVTTATYGRGRTFLIRHSPLVRGRSVDGGSGELLRRVIAAAGVRPEIRIDGAGGLVEARFLESADAMLIIALNYATTPRTVTFRFGPDVPEAIWQNMESGAAVNFVQGSDGPTYTRTFAGRDAMVLVRGKRLR